MSLSWRRLLRFLRASDVELVEKDDEENAPLMPQLHAPEPTPNEAGRLASAALRASHVDSTPNLRALALQRGAVEVLAKAPNQQRSVLAAHDRDVVAVAVVGDMMVLTIGVDDAYNSLKVWRFDAGTIQCISTLRFSEKDAPTALAVRAKGHDATAVVAVGFADGGVVLMRGDVSRERVTRKRIAPAPGEMSKACRVVALGFADDDALFVVTKCSVAVITVSSDTRTVLDTCGTEHPSLCALLPPFGQFCVARQEALYFYTKDGRGPCLAFSTPGPDGYICAVGKYLLHSMGRGEVVAYDILNKVLAYKGKGDVRWAFDDGDDSALICMKDGTVRKLVQVALRERIGMLLDRELYTAAVSLARSEIDGKSIKKDELLTLTIRKYAEHLIERNEFDTAAEQLVETIGGNVEPSWVITRLVEQPGLRSGLRLYLEALHAAGKAAFVHTKVLITCYRHDRARTAVLPSASPSSTRATDDQHVITVLGNVDWKEYQVDSAIVMCRNAGLFRVAEQLARGRARNVALAQVLVEDLDDLQGALALLNSIEDDHEVSNLLSYIARELLIRIPAPFVDFLANSICKSSVRAQPGTPPVIQLADYSAIFSDRPRWYAVLLERVLARPGGLPLDDLAPAWMELFEALVCIDVAERVAAGLPDQESSLMSSVDAPSSAFDDKRSMSNATFSDVFPRNERPSVGRRALKILYSRRSNIDHRQALRICEIHGHDLCMEYCYEYLHMYHELATCLRLFAPRACEELAAMEREKEDAEELGITNGKARVERYSMDALNEVMTTLERSGILSPLQIIELVTDTVPDTASWKVVSEFFEQSINAMNRNTTQEEYNGQRLSVELQELRNEAQKLGDEAVVMRPQNCAACGEPAAVPMMHFFCGCSYHAGCLVPAAAGGGGIRLSIDSIENIQEGMWVEECPKCAPEQDAAIAMRQAIEERNVKHDEFFSLLKSSRDGFATVVDYLARSPHI